MGPLVDMLARYLWPLEPQPQRPRTSRAPAMVGATLYSVYDELLMQAGPGLS